MELTRTEYDVVHDVDARAVEFTRPVDDYFEGNEPGHGEEEAEVAQQVL